MSAIKKEVVIGDCRLILGDCLEVMPLLGKVDAVVTDPPYGIETIVGGYGRGGKHKILNDKTLDVCHNALNAVGDIFFDIRVLAFYSCKVTPQFLAGIHSLDYFGEIIWDKKIPGLGANFRYQHENIAIFTNGDAGPIGEGFSVFRSARNPDLHPHQKPIDVMIKAITVSGGNTILDCFMGSGSTMVACAKLGRKGIGIELDPEYFEIACQRVQAAYDQPDLFVEQPKPPPLQKGFDL